MLDIIDIKETFQSIDAVAIVLSDGNGNLVEVIKNDSTNAASLAEGADITVACLEGFAEAQGIGKGEIAMQICENGIIVTGQLGEHNIAVISSSDSNIGLILTSMRKIVNSRKENG